MSRRNVVGATVVTAALGVGAAVPAAGAAQVPHKLRTDYLKTYKQVKKLGGGPGRNIVRDGVRGKHGHRSARVAEVRRSLQVLRNMRASLRGGTVRGGSAAGTTAAAHGGGGGGLPACTWQPESGGDYGAQGPGGAGGKYQIIPSTWQAYGGSGGSAAAASPAEQDAVAARIYAGQGASAWVNC